MKKIISISLVVASFAATSSFGQGYFQFVTSKSQAYDGSGATSVLAATVDVTFLWAPVGTANSGILATGSTRGTSNTLATAVGYTDAQAWTAILNSGFTPAVNSSSSAAAIQLTAANGFVSYNGGANFGVTGTASPTGTTQYALFMVGWTGGYASVAAAATAGAPVGWSSVFTYTAGQAANSSLASFAGQTAFGVFSPAVVPEPTTLALAGLSGASLLLFRRKK